MPSITTHHIFGIEVYKNLKEKNILKNDLLIYQTFTQSHDYLYYYTFDFKNAKKIKNLGSKGHHEKTQEYIINIIKNIKKNNLSEHGPAIAYLYGVITHYVLDSTCHPYIFYKTGVYRKHDKNTHKYLGGHTHIEKQLDAYYYKKYFNKDYKYCNINKEIIKNPIFSNELTNLITASYKETYNIDNIGNIYQKCIKDAKIIMSLRSNDRFGIKKGLYRFIDLITRNKFHLKYYSTHINKIEKTFLNEDRQTWHHPSNKEITYNYSFEDLFNLSLKKTISIIEDVNQYLYDRKDLEELKESIPNVDYSTGFDLDKNIRMDYFEY